MQEVQETSRRRRRRTQMISNVEPFQPAIQEDIFNTMNRTSTEVYKSPKRERVSFARHSNNHRRTSYWTFLLLAVLHTHPIYSSTTSTNLKRADPKNDYPKHRHEFSKPFRHPRRLESIQQLTPEEEKEDAVFLARTRSLQGTDVGETVVPGNNTFIPTLEVSSVPELETKASTTAPSITPSPSNVQSSPPTGLDSNMPTPLPSVQPSTSESPTITPQPTKSFSPTISNPPTMQPTTDFPSMAPTFSMAPSTLPSQIPSMRPSESSQPSFFPSVSNAPTVSSMPSSVPSQHPSVYPSNIPSQPSEYPSMLPTIVLEDAPFLADKIYMILDGLSAELTDLEQEIWQNVTSQHIIDFWDMLRIDHPEDAPIFVSSVLTQFLKQAIEMETLSIHGEGSSTSVVLRISYTQEFRYGIFGDDEGDEAASSNTNEGQTRQGIPVSKNSEMLQYLLVIMPFQTDSYEYSNALTEALNLTSFVVVRKIEAGDPPPFPISVPIGSNISQTAVRAISASIVVGACLIVAFLLWDRKRKDLGRFPADTESDYGDSRHGRRRGMDELEFDNAGQPVDWTNPYSEGAAAPVIARGGNGGGGATAGGNIASRAGTGNGSGATSVSSREGSQSSEAQIGPLTRATSVQSVPSANTSPTLSTVVASAPPPPVPIFGRNAASSRRTISTGSLPPLAPGGISMNNNGAFYSGAFGGSGSGRESNRSPFPLRSVSGVPQRGANWRQISMTDTELTDLSYSDFQSDGRGSDVGNLMQLPPISDESLREDEPLGHNGSAFFSPLHIPDEEAVGLADGLTAPSSPTPSITDLASDVTSPVMTGFDMQILELE